MQTKSIYLRNEVNAFERRTPLTPNDAKRCIENGCTVYVESSSFNCRVFTDDEYIEVGAKIVQEPWTAPIFKDCFVLGLKTPHLRDLENASTKMKHLFFSHTFRKQLGYEQLLRNLWEKEATFYDLEYMTNSDGKRQVAFGEYAGFVGGGLGILQYFTKLTQGCDISDLPVFANRTEYLSKVAECASTEMFSKIKIAIIGGNGRCGVGVRTIMDNFEIEYDVFERFHEKTSLSEYDLIYNCILLDPDFSETWDLSRKDSKVVLVDISCDATKSNHPFHTLYNQVTTWENPVLTVGHVDIIAIDSLPSLLPRESSEQFSKDLTDLLLNEDKGPLERSLQAYREATMVWHTPVYVVNFQDEDRKAKMTKRFETIGISPYFTPAVFSSDPRLENLGLCEKGRRTSSIMLQHLDSLRHFLNETTANQCIVCEDDILISNRIKLHFPEIVSSFHHLKLDVLLMGALIPYYVDPDTNYHYERRFRTEKYQYTKFPEDLWGSQMYMISRKNAEHLLATYPPEYITREPEVGESKYPYNPDWILTKRGNRAMIYPLLAVEEGHSKSGDWSECNYHERCFRQNFVEGVHI